MSRAWTARAAWLAVAAAALALAVASAGSGAGTAADPLPELPCTPGQPGVVYGTSAADKISGTAGADVICGLGGNDRIDGRGGNDQIYGGPGNDALTGGDGDDRLYGESGDDSLDGGTGNDGLYGGDGVDALEGAAGDDGLVGGAGPDRMNGADGRDALAGGDGDDFVSGAAGDDSLDGGAGRDSLDGATGVDACRNGEVLSGCETGPQDSLTTPLPFTPPVAGPQTFTRGGTFPGVSLTLQTRGGIYPWDVGIGAARQHMAGRISQLMAGPAVDISVPDGAPPIAGGSLTLPYQEGRLGDTTESELRIWTFDEASQFWVPVAGPQTVDPVHNTVTAPLQHLSVYAVLKVRTPEQWRQIFGQTPLRCAGGTAAGIDVVFLVDMSGSMSSNDPTNQRVAGAKAFVDAMRPQDRAAVVGFDSVAYPQIGLTPLDSSANVTSVKAAIDNTGQALDGTDISVAVRQAISILNANGGGGRLRVAILLTDGQSPYDTSLTTQAANAAIEIHTVGLGVGTDVALLQGIANGTGATYRHLDNAAQLPDLYRQLAGDIIGGGVDTDGDGLSDCVERNGMFLPISITFPIVGTLFEGASFLVTDPENADTDGDGLLDGEEVEAHDIASNPDLASTYDFLVADGLTTYYTLIADPTKKDTDGDGYDDKYEIDHGMNPLVPDPNELGIEGLDLPAFTLFQPDKYAGRPAVERRLVVNGNNIEEIVYNSTPVRYDGDRNCVETCDAIRKLAEDRPNDNGWGICIGGFGACVTDESQMRDIVEEARVKQGVFDKDGNLDNTFLQQQVAFQCAIWYSDAQKCFDEAAKQQFDNRTPEKFLDLLAAGTIALPVPRTANPETVRRIAEALAKTAAVVAAGWATAQVADVVKKCIEGPVLGVLGTEFRAFRHPCEELPVYSPGGDVQLAAQHRVDAILQVPTRLLESYASQAERAARAFKETWYIGQPGCTEADKQAALAQFGVPVACDEFPNKAMEKAGPGASIRYIPFAVNSLEGTRLGQFYNACPEVTRPVRNERLPFLVVPLPSAPATVWYCGG